MYIHTHTHRRCNGWPVHKRTWNLLSGFVFPIRRYLYLLDIPLFITPDVYCVQNSNQNSFCRLLEITLSKKTTRPDTLVKLSNCNVAMSYYAPLILALFVALAGGLKDCYQANNLYTAVCHSVPICNQTTNRFYSRLRHVTFDLADRSEIRSKAFANCSIHQPMTFEFRNVANIR